jgi:hypothetical protein
MRNKTGVEMNTSEGTHWIRLFAKRIMLFGSLAGIALWILMSVLKSGGEAESGSIEGRPGLAELIILIAAPLACGAILWLIAWIVEGFMSSSHHE